MKQKERANGIARLSGGSEYPALRGVVKFYQRCDGVVVEAQVWGLPRTQTGFFAFHIHEGGSCEGRDFPNTGGHFNPDGRNHPSHAGDLPPLIGNNGFAYISVLTDRFTVSEIIGKVIIIHENRDDFTTQPSGNSGTKIGCGKIIRL